MKSRYSPTLRTTSTALSLALVALTFSAHGSAQPDEEARKGARAAMAAGRQARDRGDLQAALKSFTEADDIMHVPTTSLEVAKTDIALGSLVEADAILTRIADSHVSPDEPEVYAQARAEAATLEHDLSERIPRLTFSGDPAPTSAPDVSVDGTLLDTHAWTDGYAVNPGHHIVSVSSGETRLEKSVDVTEKHGQLVHFDFAAQAREAAPPSEPAEPRERAAEPRPSSGPSLNTYGVYGLSGLAVASAGAGIAFGLTGRNRKHDLENQCAPSCAPESVDRVRTMYTLANISFAVSAGSAIAAIILHAVEPSSHSARASVQPPPRRLAFDINAGPQAASVTVNGSF